MTTAKRAERIDVWPDHATALASASDGAKVFRTMTIWPNTGAARDHKIYSAGGNFIALEDGGRILVESSGLILLEAA